MEHSINVAAEEYETGGFSDRLAWFADRWWGLFLILFGAIFIFGIPN